MAAGILLPTTWKPAHCGFLPYIFLGFLRLAVLIAGVYTWEYTNTPEFCGTACHTMPPEYTSCLVSPHARIVQRQTGDLPHFAQFTLDELRLNVDWIEAGAPEE
jgi:hypothetical protein